MLDPDQLTEIRDLLAKANAQPWREDDGDIIAAPIGNHRIHGIAYDLADADAALIVALVNAAPDLLAAAETVHRVKALADEWHWTGHIDAESPLGAALRAALATPTDHHNFEEAER